MGQEFNVGILGLVTMVIDGVIDSFIYLFNNYLS